MGNLVVFRRDIDPVSRDVWPGKYPDSSDGKAWPGAFAADLAPDSRTRKSASWALTDAFRRFGLTRFLRRTGKSGTQVDLDAYLLVLLADQELTAGRDEQAQALVDAAYAAFDGKAYDQPSHLEPQR
jgi:hypothetical protein